MTADQPAPGDSQPNWRDNPTELDQLCNLGAELLHGPQAVARDTTTIDVKGEYL